MKIKSLQVGYTLTGRDANEKNDCVVRAYACAVNIPYAEAHALIARECNRRNRGRVRGFISFASKKFGAPIQVNQTLATFLNFGLGMTGKWLLNVRGHALTVENGKVISDWWAVPAGMRIIHAWRLSNDLKPSVIVTQLTEKWLLIVNGREAFTYDSKEKAESMQRAFITLKNQCEIRKVE